MTALKQEFHSHMRVIKGGNHPKKKFSKRSRFYFLKRGKRRQEANEQKAMFFANLCIETLDLMQKVARAINPAFYFERLVPHYEVLRNLISNSQESDTYSTDIIERELCIYKSFAHMNPQRLEDYNRVLMKGEDEYTALYKEREEHHFDKISGLRCSANQQNSDILFRTVSFHFVREAVTEFIKIVFLEFLRLIMSPLSPTINVSTMPTSVTPSLNSKSINIIFTN